MYAFTDSFPRTDDASRLVALSVDLEKWADGGYGVALKQDGSYRVVYPALILQDKASLFTRIASILTSGKPLTAQPLDGEQLQLLEETFDRITRATQSLFNGLDPFWRQMSRDAFCELQTVLIRMTLFVRTLSACENAFQQCREFGGEGPSCVRYPLLWKKWRVLKEVSCPEFPNSPALKALWLRVRATRVEPTLRFVREWAVDNINQLIQSAFDLHLSPAGVDTPDTHSCTQLMQRVDAFAKPYEQQLDDCILPPPTPAAMIQAFGRACEQLRDGGHYELPELDRLAALAKRMELIGRAEAHLASSLLAAADSESTNLYQSLMTGAVGRFENNREGLEAYCKMASAWRSDATQFRCDGMRTAHLMRAFESFLERKVVTEGGFKLKLSSMRATNGPVRSVANMLNQITWDAPTDPKTAQKLTALVQATEEWREVLIRLGKACGHDTPQVWPADLVVQAVTRRRSDFGIENQTADNESMPLLSFDPDRFPPGDSDVWLSSQRSQGIEQVMLGPQGGFNLDLFEAADQVVACVDGAYRFRGPPLLSLPGMLANESQLIMYGLTVADADLLIRVAIGDTEHIAYDADTWERFLTIDQLGDWLLSEEVWQAARPAVAAACLRELPADEFGQALCLGNSRPHLQLAELVSTEFERRLAVLDRPIEQLLPRSCPGLRTLDVDGAGQPEEFWNRLALFMRGCNNLKVLRASPEAMRAGYLITAAHFCPSLGRLTTRD